MKCTVKIDASLCLSSGNCVSDAPGAFAWGEDELATATSGAALLDLATLRLVAASCPGQAIRIYDDQGNEVEL